MAITKEEIIAEIARREAEKTSQSFMPEEIIAEIERREQAKFEPDFPGAAVLEPLAAMGSGAAGMAAAGLGGMAQAMTPGEQPGSGANVAQYMQEDLTYQPKTQAGQEGMKTLGDLVQKGVDIVNFPISGLAGLGSLIQGEGIDKAVETLKANQEGGPGQFIASGIGGASEILMGQGVDQAVQTMEDIQGGAPLGETIGGRVTDVTGSPLAGTMANVLPTAGVELAALKGAGPALGAAKGGAEALGSAVGTIAKPLAPVAGAAGDVARSLLPPQGGVKQKIAAMLEDGSVAPDTAVWEIIQPATPIGEMLSPDIPRVQKGPQLKEAIKQGFDAGVVASVKQSSPADITAFKRMVNIMEKGKKNAKYAVTNRPSDVAGDLLMDRVKTVMTANKDAGKKLDKVAGTLRNQSVDSAPAIETFIADLNGMGIRPVIRDNKLTEARFLGSDIEGLTAPINAVKRMINRMKNADLSNAYQVHRLKKFIDEQVSFGKAGEGLTGKTENVLKKFRRNLDQTLDENFPEYDAVNTDYSVTKSALDELQDVTGRKMDLKGANAQKATGTILRRLMSNAQSRVTLLDAVNNIENVSKKYGNKTMDEDLVNQVLFVDELDRVFGPVARTSFQGQIQQPMQRAAEAMGASTAQTAMKYGGEVIEGMRGINEEGAFKAMGDLLDNLEKRGK